MHSVILFIEAQSSPITPTKAHKLGLCPPIKESISTIFFFFSVSPKAAAEMPKKPFSSLFSRKKSPSSPPPIAFPKYYTNWINTLTNTLLPLLRQSLSSSSSQSILCSHIDLLLQHFLSYYDTLDLAVASSENLPRLLFPSWRNSLEVPFLFLGDLHPYLFTNLLRSFLDDDDDEDDDPEEEGEENDDESSCSLGPDDISQILGHRPWQVAMAWKNVSKSLMPQVEQIECGLRLMVPALTDRIKKVQGGFLGRIAENWAVFEGKREQVKPVIEEAMKEEMEEMVTVFVDTNRLRKSVITEIVGALSANQAALYLEALAQFLVGFRNPELISEFKRSNNTTTAAGGFHIGL